jgi:hypothetical protein
MPTPQEKAQCMAWFRDKILYPYPAEIVHKIPKEPLSKTSI